MTGNQEPGTRNCCSTESPDRRDRRGYVWWGVGFGLFVALANIRGGAEEKVRQ